MTGMNDKWVLRQLDDFIRASTLHYVPQPSGAISTGSYRTDESEEKVVMHVQVVEWIFV